MWGEYLCGCVGVVEILCVCVCVVGCFGLESGLLSSREEVVLECVVKELVCVCASMVMCVWCKA